MHIYMRLTESLNNFRARSIDIFMDLSFFISLSYILMCINEKNNRQEIRPLQGSLLSVYGELGILFTL